MSGNHESFLLLFLLFLLLETEFLCAALAVLGLTQLTRLTPDSLRFTCVCLPSAGTKGVGHHHPTTMKVLSHHF